MPNRKKPELTAAIEKNRPRSPRVAEVDAEAPPLVIGPTDLEVQIQSLEQGLRLFREQRFAEARQHFEAAARGPQAPVRLTAKTHLSVCERRLQRPALALESADDHYNYGVERLNARDLPAARKHLEIALALRPGSEYILYAFAATLALSGDIPGAYENLKRAIEIHPRNRNAARQDPDFAGIVHSPIFAQLFHPERGH
jgi:tetratricopeptide (TPR) repeat protein